MTMIAEVGLTLAVLVIGVVLVAATRPPAFRVTRSASIAAPAATVFAQVNDFHRWPAWNPWATIEELVDGHTLVTWSMSGEKTFKAKAIGLVVSMDRMIGGQFEQGLTRMKSIVEGGPAARGAV